MENSVEPNQKKSKFPLWAKVLIAMVIIGFISIVAAGVFLYFSFSKAIKQAQDPSIITSVAKQIADFQEPLPKGFKLVLGIDMAGVKALTAKHDPDQQVLELVSYPKLEGDGKAMVDKFFESGLSGKFKSAHVDKIEQQGIEKVGGIDMPYKIAQIVDKSGSQTEVMVGCVVLKPKNKTLFIIGSQPGSNGNYSLAITEDFLKSIKSFN